ncbi:MAG: ribonuclease D [Candidatus Woesearchaeota archaeon]
MTPEITENIVYVATKDELRKACEKLSEKNVLGIDFECENNLHHYGAYLTLIQISDGEKDYLIDVIELERIDCLLDIFKNDAIEKIFHDVSFDLRMLQHQFNTGVCNLIDTQMLAMLNGEENLGLGALLMKYFDVKKINKFQKADWTKRPLSREMLTYASGDSKYLIRLKEKLLDDLERKGRESWAREECKHLETLDYTYKEQQASDIKGYSRLSGDRKSILSAVFELREKLAERVDMPPHFIINNKKLLEVANNPPETPKGWAKMRGVHPIVKRYSGMFTKKVKEAQQDPIKTTRTKPKRYSQSQREQFTALSDKRDALSEKLGIAKSLILSKDQMKDIVITGKYDSLRSWQKELVTSDKQEK